MPKHQYLEPLLVPPPYISRRTLNMLNGHWHMFTSPRVITTLAVFAQLILAIWVIVMKFRANNTYPSSHPWFRSNSRDAQFLRNTGPWLLSSVLPFIFLAVDTIYFFWVGATTANDNTKNMPWDDLSRLSTEILVAFFTVCPIVLFVVIHRQQDDDAYFVADSHITRILIPTPALTSISHTIFSTTADS